MKIITRQDLADRAHDRWHNLYFTKATETWRDTSMMADSGEIYTKICLLGPHPKPEHVDAVIGNDSLTRLTCNCCRRDVARVVAVDVTHGEYATHLCADCVIKMMDLLATPH